MPTSGPRLTLLGGTAFCRAVASEARLHVSHVVYSTVQPAFDTGRRLDDRHYLHLVTEGALLARFDDGARLRVGPGQGLWTRPGVPHRLWLAPEHRHDTRCYSLRLRVGAADGEAVLRPRPDRQYLERADPLLDVFRRLSLAARTGGLGADYVARAQLLELLARWLRLAESPAADAVFDAGQVRALQQYLDRELANSPQVADLAAVLGLSPAYFSDRFREHFGESPRAWLTRQRLERAAAMLVETPLRIQEVAAAVGYADQRYFARQFRRHYGRSPRTYRRGLPAD